MKIYLRELEMIIFCTSCSTVATSEFVGNQAPGPYFPSALGLALPAIVPRISNQNQEIYIKR